MIQFYVIIPILILGQNLVTVKSDVQTYATYKCTSISTSNYIVFVKRMFL